ncbi:MAG: amidohydrolase [Rhodothermales bacterium]
MRLLFFLLLLAPAALAQETGDLLIRGATVLTVTNGTLADTDVLVRDGKIAEIGSDLRAPRGVRTIDATGRFLMPGIVDAHSHIGISSVNEATSPVTAQVWVGDVLNPLDVRLYRALAGGVTTSHAMHGSANVIGGQNETIKHRWGVTDPEALRFEGAPRTIKFALGENPTRVHGKGRGIRPATRMGVETVIRDAFTEAQRYRERQDAYAAARRDDRRAMPPAYDLQLETLADILDGEILVHTHSYRADEILMLLRVLDDFGIRRVTFQHANEGFKVAPELAAFGAGASVFSDWYAYKFEVYYSTAFNAAILARNGVRTSINSDSAELIRHLYHEAAKAQHYGGLSDDEALALITLNPAWQLGVDDRVGSIEIGKDADLALFESHPLSSYAVPVLTVVDGVVRFDRAEDPDDVRLFVDPEEEVDDVMFAEEHTDACLQGVAELGAWWLR